MPGSIGSSANGSFTGIEQRGFDTLFLRAESFAERRADTFALFIPERGDRIDTGCASRGNVTRKQCDED
jgi:hypothetical protein